MLLTRVLVINRVRVLADNQMFSVGLLQHLATVMGMLIAHLYGMLMMIRAEERNWAFKCDVKIDLFPILLSNIYLPCVNGDSPDIELWQWLSRIYPEEHVDGPLLVYEELRHGNAVLWILGFGGGLNPHVKAKFALPVFHARP